MPAVNTEALNEHLKEISAQVATGAHCLLLCDGAGAWNFIANDTERTKSIGTRDWAQVNV